MQLYGLCMKKGTKIHDHLWQLDEDQLTAIGEDVSEVHKVAVLLRSVQETYPTLVTALLARGDGDLTLIFVKQSLLDEEQRRGKESTVNDGDSALKVRDKKYKGRIYFRSTYFTKYLSVNNNLATAIYLKSKIVPQFAFCTTKGDKFLFLHTE